MKTKNAAVTALDEEVDGNDTDSLNFYAGMYCKANGMTEEKVKKLTKARLKWFAKEQLKKMG